MEIKASDDRQLQWTAIPAVDKHKMQFYSEYEEKRMNVKTN